MAGEHCPWLHVAEEMPRNPRNEIPCRHFERGNCLRYRCPYLHLVDFTEAEGKWDKADEEEVTVDEYKEEESVPPEPTEFRKWIACRQFAEGRCKRDPCAFHYPSIRP